MRVKIFNNWIHFVLIIIMMSCSSDDNNFEHKVLSGSVEISNQEELIDFGMLGYTKIEDRLLIRGVSDLSPLSSLLEVDRLEIRETNLINFDGLQNLTKVITLLYVIDNSLLEDMSALTNTEISRPLTLNENNEFQPSGRITIRNNDALTNLDGLENVRYLRYLTIQDNDALLNLEALYNLESNSDHIMLECYNINIGGSFLKIQNNDALLSLNGLNNARASVLTIEGNEVLPNLEGLSGIVELNHLFIIGNGNLTSLNGLDNLEKVFYDDVCGIYPGITRIIGNPLVDFCAIKNANFLEPTSVEIEFNTYNPTYDELMTEDGCAN